MATTFFEGHREDHRHRAGEERFELTEAFYEPILVWGKVPLPGGIAVQAMEILAAGIPVELGTASSPDSVGV